LVVFRDIGSARDLLPDHLPSLGGLDPWFLREHFIVSITAHILGGDIREDYSFHDVLSMMDDLGVSYCGHDEGVEMAPMSDPRWGTEIGKAIFQSVLKGRLAHCGEEGVGDAPEE